jgi:hypothetical protein
MAALAGGGILMVVAGLLTQAMCRVDKDHGDHDADRQRGGEEQPNGSHEQ